MYRRPVRILVEDILESIEKINGYLKGYHHHQFIHDEKTIDAVVRNLEIMGEAANRLPRRFRSQHREIDWYQIIGLRHRIVHFYFGIDLDMIWEIIQWDLPHLKENLGAMQLKWRKGGRKKRADRPGAEMAADD